MLDNRMVWVDIETFGLSPVTDPMIELGFKITDLDLNVIDDWSTVIWDSPTYDDRLANLGNSTDEGDKYVYDMHTRNGLWADCAKWGETLQEAEDEAVDFLEAHGVKPQEPLCGSSVDFDRGFLLNQMHRVAELFGYRVVDISTLKLLCASYFPTTYSQLQTAWVQPAKMHRVLPDLDDTIGEFKFYKTHMLKGSDI